MKKAMTTTMTIILVCTGVVALAMMACDSDTATIAEFAKHKAIWGVVLVAVVVAGKWLRSRGLLLDFDTNDEHTVL